MKIDFDNGLTGDELRMYRLVTKNGRQYSLSELKETYNIDSDTQKKELSKDDKGNIVYRECDIANYPNIDQIKRAYVKKEEYNNNINSDDYDSAREAFEALGLIIKQACITALSIEESINAAIERKDD